MVKRRRAMLKILVVDDENMEREMLKKGIAAEFGHKIELQTAENGRIAVIVATLWNADIILMDIEMPGQNGIEAAKQILEQRPGIKIIFITAYSLFSYAHEAVKLGASDYILKPVELKEVFRAIRQAADQIETQKQLEALAPEADSIASGEEGNTDKANQLIARVKRYLQHNYMAYDLSLDSVSGILNINASYLSVLFKKCTGVNFIDYIADLKVNAAKELLKDPLKSAAEIASMVGYESASYFTRAFKKRTGQTPTEYRRSTMKIGEDL
jgi:Response regulator containing CheY-like receiver domain and AraC-type DNA-binding domain